MPPMALGDFIRIRINLKLWNAVQTKWNTMSKPPNGQRDKIMPFSQRCPKRTRWETNRYIHVGGYLRTAQIVDSSGRSPFRIRFLAGCPERLWRRTQQAMGDRCAGLFSSSLSSILRKSSDVNESCKYLLNKITCRYISKYYHTRGALR